MRCIMSKNLIAERPSEAMSGKLYMKLTPIVPFKNNVFFYARN